jgi:hypothetical protein
MESIFTILQSIAPNEFPIIMYQNTNYIGTPELIFDLDNKITQNDVKSLYVPGHLRLDIFSNDGKKTCIYGPVSIPNLAALMLFWDDGSRVAFSDDLFDSQISHIIPKRITNWNLYLHNLLSKQRDLMVNQETIKFDKDAFFQQICANGSIGYKCDCFNSYLELSSQHPNMELYIDLLNPKCQPSHQYTHSKSLIASNAKNREELCVSMFNKMITHETLKPWESGGPEYFICDSKYYNNVIIPDKNKRFDDETDKLIELAEMPSNIAFVYFLLILLFFLVVYMVVFACHYLNQTYSPSKKNSLNLNF